GFEEVDITNLVGGAVNLTLADGMDLAVNIDNEASSPGGSVILGNGTTTLNLGTMNSYQITDTAGAATITTSGSGSSNQFHMGSGAVTITANDYGDQFYLGSGTATITANNYWDVFYLGSGTTTLNLGNGYDSVFVSSGQTTV